MTCIGISRTTQLLEGAFDVVDARLAGHRHREDGFKRRNSHVESCEFECNVV